ncbi:MAG TPA: hypothetical protein VFE78_02870 [Gemmataceae bacterium]|nr:hypothetical protein [Gemmataceae bacterium]
MLGGADVVFHLAAQAGLTQSWTDFDGDQRHTFADTAKLRRDLGWRPRTGLREGLAQQWEWQRHELQVVAAAPTRRAPRRAPLAPAAP